MSKSNVLMFNSLRFERRKRGLDAEVPAAAEGVHGFFNVVKGGVRLFNREGELQAILSTNTESVHSAVVTEGKAYYFFSASSVTMEWLGLGGEMGGSEERRLVGEVLRGMAA